MKPSMAAVYLYMIRTALRDLLYAAFAVAVMAAAFYGWMS